MHIWRVSFDYEQGARTKSLFGLVIVEFLPWAKTEEEEEEEEEVKFREIFFFFL